MTAPRDMMAAFAKELRAFIESEKDQGLCPPSLNFERSEYIISALELVLSGVPIKNAFGLSVRGQPAGSGDHFATALMIDDMQRSGKSVSAIARELHRDRKDVREIIERYRNQISAHRAKAVVEALNKSPPPIPAPMRRRGWGINSAE